MSDASDGNILEHLDLSLAEGTGRSDNDALAGVDSQRVEVFHRGDSETAVSRIPDALELDFLPSFQTLLDEYLRSKSEGRFCNLPEFFFGLADSGTLTSQGIGRTDHDRIAYSPGSCHSAVDVLAGFAHRYLQVYLVQLLDEEVPVFGVHYRLDAGSEDLDAIFIKNSFPVEFCAAVQGCLAAEGKEDAVRALLLDDLSDEERRHGQEIDLVRNAFRSLDRCDVGVDEY